MSKRLELRVLPTCDDNFGLKGKSRQPGCSVLELRSASTVCQVSSMNQDVARWDCRSSVVSVRYTDDPSLASLLHALDTNSHEAIDNLVL